MCKSISVSCISSAGAAAAPALLVAGAAVGAPVLAGTAEVRSAAAPIAIDTRWYGRRWHRGYYRYYGWRRYGSGCHMAGGYYRPSLCW